MSKCEVPFSFLFCFCCQLQEIVADDFRHSSMQEGDDNNIDADQLEFQPLEGDPPVEIG